jgi:ABC-type transporter Mla MlaB component
MILTGVALAVPTVKSTPRLRLTHMLKIQRSEDDGNVFKVSGQINVNDLTQLEEIVSREPDHGLTLDLRELKLIDADGIQFLIRCEARGIRVENCPAYIKEWMSKEKR